MATPQAAKRAALLTDVTDAERWAARNLILSTMQASADHRDRALEVWGILLKRQWASPPSWSQLFDEVTEADVGRLRELYDAMEDGARMEFEARYGRPQL